MSATKSDTIVEEHSGKVKLLIVDDDPMTCQLLKLQLEMEGYLCATLSDPDQILETVAVESPMLVLVDYYLGPYDGLDLLDSIRNHKGYQNLPIVIMSGMDHQRESEAAGANGFVLKPFSLEDLTATIQKVLGQ